jgi:hypothetical protein
MLWREGSMARLVRYPLLMAMTLFLWCAPARAHDLKADYRVLPGQKVRVESWFQVDEPAVAAVVEVYRVPDGQKLFQGKTDAEGVCVFEFKQVEDLRARILAGAGHAATLTIPASRLRQPDSISTIVREDNTGAVKETSSVPRIDRTVRAGDVLKDVIVGVGFLLGLAAFLISLRNAQRIESLRRGIQTKDETAGP